MQIKVTMKSESAAVRKPIGSRKSDNSSVRTARSKPTSSRKPKAESADAIQRKIDKLSHDREVISAEIKELRVQLRSARAKTSPRK